MAGWMLRGEETSLGSAGYCCNCATWMEAGPDACLGWLPDVAHACCGHGIKELAYVVIGESRGPDEVPPVALVLRDDDALAYFALVGRPVPERRGEDE